MSITISSRSKVTAPTKPVVKAPFYDSEEENSDASVEERHLKTSPEPRDEIVEDHVASGGNEEEQDVTHERKPRRQRRKNYSDDEKEAEDQEEANNEKKINEDEDKAVKYNGNQNGISHDDVEIENEAKKETNSNKKESLIQSLGSLSSVPPLALTKAPKNWPPPAPKKYDAFAVEGHGRINPYTKEFIPDKLPEEEQEEEDHRLEIDEGHTKPVTELKKNWQGSKQPPRLGVQRPAASVQGNQSWIKHVKPPIEYEEPPKEPGWLQLVRNRRWNSTVKARFPCQNADITEFERRSTTPKNWKRLLCDKKAVRTIGEITGIGAEGEELLWRLAKQRGKVDTGMEGQSTSSDFPIPGEQDLLAYEHIKNLEAAVVEAAIQAGIDVNEYMDDNESVVSSVDSTVKGRKQSESSTVTTTSLRQRLLHLHPEEFKKLLALDRARDAHLRWQFSTDPYDSVHEHQLRPFEISLLSGERENRLRYLLKKLLKTDNISRSRGSSGRATPVYNKSRARSLSASCNASDQESDSGSSISTSSRSRGRKKAPVPLPRKGRSVSPSFRQANKDEEVHGFLGPEDEHIKSELKKLEQMTQGMGLPPEIGDLLNNKQADRRLMRERPEDSITMGLDDRKRGFANEEEGPVKSSHEKEEPLESITRSLADRKMSFLDEARKATSGQTRKTDDSDQDDQQDGGKVSDIDTSEISSRRRRFLDQEKEAQSDKKLPEKEKKRHKVQRIKSDAELYAVLSKRRMATDDDEDTEATIEEPSSEMKGLLDNITKTFGGEQYTRKGKRKPKFQGSSDDEDHRQVSESIEEDEDESGGGGAGRGSKDKAASEDYDDDNDEAPTRRSRRHQRPMKITASSSTTRRQRRARTKDWSESDSHDDEHDYDDADKDERLKNFADQRIRVKAKGRHKATRNPVRQLQDREDLRSDTDEYLSVGSSYSSQSEVKLIGRNKIIATGKQQERNDLADDARKGLESKEDIKGASQGLRRTGKDKSGISTDRINQYDGVKPVMLFHVKGARNIQTRLVEPSVSSLNSGDVFVMVTPKSIHQWNGKFCSIMEKARGTEITSVINQWKEMNCDAGSINTMDQGKERETRAAKEFWKNLGGKSKIADKDDVLEDAEFEKYILKSTKIYEVEIDENEDTEIVLLEEYEGKVPSKKWLKSNSAYVLDFGSEVYTWIGKNCQSALRRKAVNCGLEVFEQDYVTSSKVSPLFPNERNPHKNKPVARPSWAVFGKMTDKSENVLFRRKFYDWPDPVDLKVRTAEAKVHVQLTKDLNEYHERVELLPIDGKKLASPADEPVMIVNEMLIGRGKGDRDPETLFRYAVQTTGIQMWKIVEKNSNKLDEDSYGFMFSAEAYIVRWSFQYMRTGIRNIKGGKSKQQDTGKDCLLYFYWQGKDCSVADKGTAALMMSEIDSDEGPQMLVTQGKEPPAFYQLFDDKMVVNLGRQSEDTKFKNTRMYYVRNEDQGEACMVEMPVTSANLRSRGSIIVCDPPDKTIYLWQGTKASDELQERAVGCAKSYRNRIKRLYQKKFEIQEIVEGEETDSFWDALGDDEDYVSYLGVSKNFDFSPRCMYFSSIHNEFVAKEMNSSTFLPSAICPFPITQDVLYAAPQPALFFIDAKFKMFLWQGWWPISDEEHEDEVGPTTGAEKHRFDVNRKLAMQSILNYAETVGRPKSKAFIIYAGLETLEFKNLFPHWEDEEEIADVMRKAGKRKSARLKVEDELAKLSKNSYSLEQLKGTDLPEGVDPTRAEQYLHDDDFSNLFSLTKEEFNKLPRWKQIQLKKDKGFF
eukprot:gene5929-6615_t